MLLTGCGDDPEDASRSVEDLCAQLVDFERVQNDLDDEAAAIREVADGAPDDIRPALERWADAQAEQDRTHAGSMSGDGEAAREEVTNYYEENCVADGS